MLPSEYIKNCLRTLASPNENIGRRMWKATNAIHAIFGLLTELGELATAFKKWIWYGKELDRVNIAEEIGDLFWYLAILCNHFGFSFEEIWVTNIKKLQTRYPENFTEELAINRNLFEERQVLENGKS